MKKTNSILVVEDADQLRHFSCTFLRQAGYEVFEAATGLDGLQLAEKHRPDLVLLDVRLPDCSGLEICRQIKQSPNLKDVSIILCSGEAIDSENKIEGLRAGADEYVVKPFGLDELLARVQALLRLHNVTAALRISEEQHRRLIDMLPDAVCLIHPQGRLLTANLQAAVMLGYRDPESLIDRNIFEFIAGEEQERMRLDINKAQRAGIIRDSEYTMIKKNGVPFQVEFSATLCLDMDSQPASLLSVLHDITERRQQQIAIQESEERFQQLANHIIHGVFWMSNVNKTQMIYVSPAYEEIWGRSCNSLYNSPADWFETIHPEDRGRIETATANLQSTGKYDEIYRVVRTDRSVRWIHDRAFPICDSMGNVYRIAGIADDITARKQAWDSVGESEARKQAIMQAALDSIITVDNEGRILEANSATERIFGLNRSKIIGERMIELIPQDFRQWFQHGLSNSFAGDKGPVEGSRIEMPAKRSDGSQFSAELTVTPICLTGPPIFTFYIRDITKRKHAETELRSLPQRIIKAQEAERSRIAQELHDGINQLVASVKMRLRKVDKALPELRPSAREILRRCDNLLIKVLEENRRIAHNLKPTQLDNFGLATACRSFCEEIQSRTNLQFEYRLPSADRRLPSVMELHLFRIVQEAVNNIVKHARAKLVKLEINVQRGFITLKIQDNGRGFDVKKPVAGRTTQSGLGLTNIRERVLSLGGSLKMTSSPGNGTTITASIPLSEVRKKNAQA